MKLLVAEDDAFFRRILQQLLAPEFNLLAAENGSSAWEMLQQKDNPRIAVLDWVMPGMTGPQICRQVRANARTADIYLILLTSKNSAADIAAGMRAGADDYVTKPFEPEELRVRVRTGKRIVDLQTALATQQHILDAAVAREKILRTRLQTLQEETPQTEVAKTKAASV
jgi:DNA-binding response OmpR family regulator